MGNQLFENPAPKLISVYRGYSIFEEDLTSFLAAGTKHGSIWSAKCYIDELLSP